MKIPVFMNLLFESRNFRLNYSKAGGTFDDSFFNNYFDLVQQCKDRSFQLLSLLHKKLKLQLIELNLVSKLCSINVLFDFLYQVRFGQVRLGQVRLGQVRLGQVRLGQVRLGQVRLGQVRLGQVRLGQVMLGQVRLGQVRLGWVGLGWVRLGQVGLGQVR